MAKSRRRLSRPKKTRKNHANLWKDGSVGRGRSKSIYIPPVCTDTAVLISYFNPAQFKRLFKNLQYVLKTLRDEKIPVFVVECVFFDRKPELPDADLTLRSNSIMFYKEQLLNKLEKVVPEKYTKLVLMDGDIIFGAPDWLDQISKKLDSADVVQPFSNACWLYPDNTRVRARKPSYGYAIAHGQAQMNTPDKFHPGFVWSLKRSIFRDIGGLYDKGIAGNGDVMFTFTLINNMSPIYIQRYAPCLVDTWNEYNEGVQKIQPSVSYIDIDVYHLFHGLTRKRQYVSRHAAIKERLSSGWDEHVTINADGLYEFKDPALSNNLLEYFKGRDEDIPLEVAMLPAKRTDVKL
jgi:hypothetical protein